MTITPDTNVLVRAVVRDDAKQAAAAVKALREADVIAVTLPCLCEFVWVLRRVYKLGPESIAAAVEALLQAANVVADGPAVEAGLALLKAGGDFADGAIAHAGRRLGGEMFLSFDQGAVGILTGQGFSARVLR